MTYINNAILHKFASDPICSIECIDTQEGYVEKIEKNRHIKLICRSNRHKLTQ